MPWPDFTCCFLICRGVHVATESRYFSICQWHLLGLTASDLIKCSCVHSTKRTTTHTQPSLFHFLHFSHTIDKNHPPLFSGWQYELIRKIVNWLPTEMSLMQVCFLNSDFLTHLWLTLWLRFIAVRQPLFLKDDAPISFLNNFYILVSITALTRYSSLIPLLVRPKLKPWA